MKDQILQRLSAYQRSFSGFTAGQKVVAILGTGALLLAGVMVFRWVSQPDYAPLFSNLSSQDASAVIEQLDSQGVNYKLSNGGDTVMVPRNDVYKTRIKLSGEGLPSGSDGGYSLLDKQDLSTSQFKEQTDYKRAMEGELTKTIEAMDGVQSAVVHLAIPAKQVFADKQDPPTASVLVSTRPGDTLSPEQVQSVVHLVAASIDGMDPEKVTVADSTGKLLSTNDSLGGGAATSRNQYVSDFQDAKHAQVQSLLDRVVGPGNSTTQVTADLNFDKTVTEARTYTAADPKGLSLSSTKNTEDYTGPAGSSPAGGVVGPDGQMDTSTSSTSVGTTGSAYKKRSETADAALNTKTEHREAAPGGVESLHVAVALDRTAAANNDPAEIEKMISAAVGLDRKRGDSVRVSVLPFDRTAEKTAAKEVKAEALAAAKADRMNLFRNGAIGALVLLGLLAAWLRGRRRNKQRQEATTYVVEQLRNDAARRDEERTLENPATALLSLERGTEEQNVREELIALVENQPEDVAALLRGWLVER
ncbi:MAG: fliF [Marmoricola sp.]|nr:fliF [Marmoricola sp.]